MAIKSTAADDGMLQSHDLTKSIGVIAFVTVAVKLMGTVFLGDLRDVFSNNVINITMLVAFEMMILMSREFRIDKTLTLFCSIALLSTIINEPPAFYRSYERLGFFVIMLCLLSPMLQSSPLTRFRDKVWNMLIWGLRIIVSISVISFSPRFWGEWCTLHLPCSVCHSMLLGILDAVVIVEMTWRLLNRKHSRLTTAGFLIALLLWSVLLVLTGSRCSIMGAIAGVITVMVLSKPDKRTILKTMLFIATLAGVLMLTPGKSTRIINYKFKLATTHGSITYSRDNLWGARWLEFEESPIIGIGFANATHYSQMPEDTRTGDEDCRISEPGSSWLSTLSNTGILGFLVLAWFNVSLIKKLISSLRRRDKEAILFCGLLILLLIHGCFEGWILYGGSATFFIYWLLTSKIHSLTAQ